MILNVLSSIFRATASSSVSSTTLGRLAPLPLTHRKTFNSRAVLTQKKQDNIMNVFNRKIKRIQKNRTSVIDDYQVYDYLKEYAGMVMADRISDVKRKFDVAVDLGCWRGHIAEHVTSDMIGTLFQCDMAEKVLDQAHISTEVPTTRLVMDEEAIPFRDNSVDLVISSLCLHWVNDLPGALRRIFNCLRPDGVFLGCMFGGDTLYELRVSLQLAEQEMEGGFGAHISPFTEVSDVGSLLNRAGYNLITLDLDERVIRYPGMKELMYDLKGMGENNCSWRRKPMLHRKTMKRAHEIYQEMYADDGRFPATYQIIYMIGWKPDKSQVDAAPRGSATVSLKDLHDIDRITRPISKVAADESKK